MLADRGDPRAYFALGKTLRVMPDSLDYYIKAACAENWSLSLRYQSSHRAMCISNILKRWPQARLWTRVVSQPNGKFASLTGKYTMVAKNVSIVLGRLRKLRQSCSQCGMDLDIANRKLCKQCKTHCYCSRERQKMHWNQKGGHRDECQEVLCLQEKMEMSIKKSMGEKHDEKIDL